MNNIHDKPIWENKIAKVSALLGQIATESESHNIAVGLSPVEKVRAAMAKMFDKTAIVDGNVPAFSGLREAYICMTGDLEFQGRYYPQKILKELRSAQDFNSGSFAYALGNAMNMYISKIYKDVPYREEVLISDKKSVSDLREIRPIQLGYFGDLPDVDPETEDYGDIAPYADAGENFNLSLKGVIISISRRHIMSDDIGLISALVNRLTRAARRTHARYVWNFYINNALSPDGDVWFTSDHGNLSGSALDISAMVTAITALANMEEPSPSNEKLGLDLASFDWNLVVSTSMWEKAVQLDQTESYFTGNDLTTKVVNACHRLFGDHNERIVTCPFITDVNDWGVICGRNDVPLVEMSYLNGKEEPEIIVSNDPNTSELMFLRDKIRYKLRHEYGGTLADYRGGYKAIVA